MTKIGNHLFTPTEATEIQPSVLQTAQHLYGQSSWHLLPHAHLQLASKSETKTKIEKVCKPTAANNSLVLYVLNGDGDESNHNVHLPHLLNYYIPTTQIR